MTFFLTVLFISITLCLGTTAVLFRKRNIIHILILGICWFFGSYVLSTMVLFLLDVYTLSRGLTVTAGTDGCVLAVILLSGRPFLRAKSELFAKPDMNIFLLPLIISLIGLPFVSQKNELFGMGQDEGVYQCQAINFIYGRDDRQQEFDEYWFLDSDDARENFQTAVHNRLVGYDVPGEDYPDTVYDREISPVSGSYHGIATYSAMPALCGKLFGVRHMADIQTVFYILAIFLICFICDNLKLHFPAKLTASLITAFSPVVIWVAKSSLTEMFLSVLILLFLFFLTDAEHPEQYRYSLIPVAVFSCYHVSVYTIIPCFLIIYAGMYFFTGRKIFAVFLPLTVLGYLLSYLVMRQVQPFYTMNNYRFVFTGAVNISNITQTVIFTSIAIMMLCTVYILLVWKFRKSPSLEGFLLVKSRETLMQILLILMTALPLIYISMKAVQKYTTFPEFVSLTLVGFAQNAGVILFPLGVLMCLARPGVFLRNKETLVIFIAFFYCVLIYSALLRPDIDYYYYYARYLVPFIPVAVLTAVTALDGIGAKLLIPAVLGSLCFSMPYSSFLIHHQDDTRMEWTVLNDITEKIHPKDCVVISNDYLSMLWLPVRAITGAHVYPAEKHTETQMMNLISRYDHVYFISRNAYANDFDNNLDILYLGTVHGTEDKNTQSANGMPLKFTESTSQLYLYQYLPIQLVYHAGDIQRYKLYGIDTYEKNFSWTVSNAFAVRCILEQKHYTLTMRLGSTLPLKEMNKDRFMIRLLVNGVTADYVTLTRNNNHQTLTFDIPEKYLRTGSNIISFETDTWEASVINPADTRIIGIPLKSLIFEERS